MTINIYLPLSGSCNKLVVQNLEDKPWSPLIEVQYLRTGNDNSHLSGCVIWQKLYWSRSPQMHFKWTLGFEIYFTQFSIFPFIIWCLSVLFLIILTLHGAWFTASDSSLRTDHSIHPDWAFILNSLISSSSQTSTENFWSSLTAFNWESNQI